MIPLNETVLAALEAHAACFGHVYGLRQCCLSLGSFVFPMASKRPAIWLFSDATAAFPLTELGLQCQTDTAASSTASIRVLGGRSHVSVLF